MRAKVWESVGSTDAKNETTTRTFSANFPVRPNWYAFLVRPELSIRLCTWFNRRMLLSMLLVFSMSATGLVALKLLSELRRARMEARLTRAIRTLGTDYASGE